ncbi:hypothetical protein BKA70DRAFT_1219167 [Coprinopsis sp. MPI-PUGE-AT-0042]|nr:hypothetical protein BKA70DRAFT_1219167 [Coprinopsis sp. MPI-PUGE-AT-0042]
MIAGTWAAGAGTHMGRPVLSLNCVHNTKSVYRGRQANAQGDIPQDACHNQLAPNLAEEVCDTTEKFLSMKEWACVKAIKGDCTLLKALLGLIQQEADKKHPKLRSIHILKAAKLENPGGFEMTILSPTLWGICFLLTIDVFEHASMSSAFASNHCLTYGEQTLNKLVNLPKGPLEIKESMKERLAFAATNEDSKWNTCEEYWVLRRNIYGTKISSDLSLVRTGVLFPD